MPYVYADPIKAEARNALAVPSSTSEVLTETFAQAYEENPIKAVRRYLELREDARTGPRLDAATARERLRAAGMESDLAIADTGISSAALATLMDRKRVEKRRQETFALAEGGLGQGAARLAVSALTSLADPASGLLNFVPVVGQGRYARMLAGASGPLGRAGVRAGVGAVEGAAGAAIVEPLIYAMRTSEQADYEAVDSLLNVTLGGFVGAGLHTTVGSAAELFSPYQRPGAQIPRDAALTGDFRVFEERLATQIGQDVEGAMAQYAKLDGAAGGKVLNTDLARELSADYRADRTRSAAVHEPASWLVKQMYERRLAQPPADDEANFVLFTGGGTGAGKTTGLELMGDAGAKAHLIYDTNLNGLESATRKIDQALAAGKDVRIAYTWRDPVEALVNGALPRAARMGRTVPLEEHVKTHVGGATTIKGLVAKYADDPRVSFTIIDNSHGKGGARLADLSVIRDLEYNRTREDLNAALEAERAAGRISETVYRGTAGTTARPLGAGNRAGDRGRSEPQVRPAEGVTAAEVAHDATFQTREAALRAAVTQATNDQPVNVAALFGRDERAPSDTSDYQAAQRLADDLAERPDPIAPDEITAELEAAAQLAEADARETAKRLGVELDEGDAAQLAEAVERGERWARAAELATVCLVRGD